MPKLHAFFILKKNFLLASLLLASAVIIMTGVASAATTGITSGFAPPGLGNQYIYIPANETNCIAPTLLCPGNGLLTQSGYTGVPTNNGFYIEQFPSSNYSTTNVLTLTFSNNIAVTGSYLITQASTTGNSCQLQLDGNPPLNSYKVPLKPNQLVYNAASQPLYYYAYVTAGKLQGEFFTIVANDINSVTIPTDGYQITTKDIASITVQPYWSLSMLFPASQSTISFIPTTNSSNVMTTLTLSKTDGSSQAEGGPTFYFDSSITNWVNTLNPNVAAGDTPVQPGQYLYLKNTGSNSYPLNVWVAGTALTNPFSLSIITSPSEATYNYFVLPRNTSYHLSQFGFNSSNFKQSPSIPPPILKTYDQIQIDNGHGSVLGTYFMYAKKWYSANSALEYKPVDPLFESGTVFSVVKAPTTTPSYMVTNYYNGLSMVQSPKLGPVNINPPPVPNSPITPSHMGGD